MPPKRPTPSKAFGNEPKHQKKVTTLHDKAQLLDMFRKGKSYAALGRYYVVNASRRTRWRSGLPKNEVAIRTTVEVSFCERAEKITVVRKKRFVRMESALTLWISDCKKKNILLSGNIIHEKARKSYRQFDRGDGAEGTEEPQPRPLTTPDP
ncbi:transposable element-derived 1-like [Octopus vulgaris]|uniref:Transposable element-derived 1-like n=1 Tax=Octopus vulgaris TaxID=6645 RepID=A0AA36AIL7_OCTVU|nr:transposable element-derived 1-like [Octopus vulgaris]